MAGIKINKKGFIVLLVLILVVALGVGLFFILQPKADLEAPYQNTYELVHNKDLSFINQRNVKIQSLLENELSGLQNETKAQTTDEFVVFNFTNEILSTQNDVLLKNLKFTESKDDGMAKLQKDIKKNFERLNERIKECKKYLSDNLTNQLYQKIYNYRFLYEKLVDELTQYYDYMSQIFNSYLSDTVAVNCYTKIAVRTTMAWTREITMHFVNYNEEVAQYNFLASMNSLRTFNQKHLNEDPLYYLNNKEQCDKIVNNFNQLNFNDCISALAKKQYDEYIETLADDAKNCATELKTYFLG